MNNFASIYMPTMLSFSLDSEKDTHVNLKHICLWTFSTGEQTSSPSKLTSGETNGYPKEHQILLAWTAQAASRLVDFPIPQNHPRGNIIRERSGYRACVTTTWNKRHHAIWVEISHPYLFSWLYLFHDLDHRKPDYATKRFQLNRQWEGN